MAQNDLARTTPADGKKIAHAATYDETRRPFLMVQVAVRVKERSGIQAIAVFESHELAAVEMAGKNEIKATLSRRLPDARVMGAQHAHMAFRQEVRLRPCKDDFTAIAKQMRAGCMNPLAVPRDDRGFHAIDADILVVIAADRENRRDLAKLADKAAQRS